MLSGCLAAVGAPVWKAPTPLKFGELQVLELREEDPSKSALQRPLVEDRLGSLRLRALEPLPDGRGWRFQVQALEPGSAVIPALDLGDGRRSLELRLQVPRSIPFGAPWMGFGGGKDDLLPAIPFPWAWASLLLLPPLALLAWGVHRWRKGAPQRRLQWTAQAFRTQWPPRDQARPTLDAVHDLGRELLAARFGEVARSWGPEDFAARGLSPWDQWARSLDAVRFGGTGAPLPNLDPLLAVLDRRSDA